MKKLSKALGEFVSEAKRYDSYWVEATKIQFALALEQRRKVANVTYKTIAELLGTSAAYVSKVFRGDTNMTIETMVKLARATGGHLVIRIADSEEEANYLDFASAATKWDTSSKTTTAPSVTLVAAVNDAQYALAA
jgi:transcriptional regulator with XRE-family HTH domain